MLRSAGLSQDVLRTCSGFSRLLRTFSSHSRISQDVLKTFSRLYKDFFRTLQGLFPGLSQSESDHSLDFLTTLFGLSKIFFGTFKGFLRTFAGLSQDFFRLYFELCQDFVRTLFGFSQDLLRTFYDFLKISAGLSQDLK